MYADVIFKSKSKYADIPFTYRIGEDIEGELKLGHRVIVPFGKSNKPTEAFVIDIRDRNSDDIKENRIKNIIDILDDEPMLTKDDIDLIKWIRTRYISTYGEAISLFYPKGYKTGAYKCVSADESLKHKTSEIDKSKMDKSEEALLDFLGNKEVPLEIIKEKFSNATVDKLKKNNLIQIFWKYTGSENKREDIYISRVPDLKSDDIRLGNRQKELLKILELNDDVAYSDINSLMGIGMSTVKSLEKKGLITTEKRSVYRTVDTNYKIRKKNIELNKEQSDVVKKVQEDFGEHKKKIPFLLYGVTGSGKTEVYLELIEKIIGMGKTCIFLVPEISLTMQTIARVKNRFGDIVGVYHSQLSDGERHDIYDMAKKGIVKIIVGTRSSIFLPMKNLGLVIVDECHDMSYRSDQSPKYDTVEICRYLSYVRGVTTLMGSATPSVADYYRAKVGEYTLLNMKNRANSTEMPNMTLVNMSTDMGSEKNYELSNVLVERIKKALEEKKQTILFLNRRGFAQFTVCKNCGHSFKCDKCDITLTYHKYSNKNICHYCGSEEKIPSKCPECGSEAIEIIGVGTQKIEEIVKSIFPDSRVLRLDKDTTTKKGDLERILSEFNEGNADILIGTQILSKGHDFENVSLVGILSADMMLNYPDFKAYESTFQLITQVAGRAGRRGEKSDVVVQSYDTKSYPILNALNYDYETFFKNEIKIRKAFGYEPFSNIIRIVFTGKNTKEVEENSKRFDATFRYMLEKEGINSSRGILGPNECSISKINNKYRWQIVIKNLDIDVKTIKAMIKYITVTKREDIFDRDISISVDINSNIFI